MAATLDLTLDTTGPQAPAASINSGATYASSRDVSLAVTTTDGANPAGYQVKIWGDVDPAFNANIQATEGASTWITMASPHSVRLAVGDGVKTLNVRIRDDVWNESSVATDTIALDTALPIVTAGAPDVTKVSKVAGKRTASFSFSANEHIQAYKVKVVPSTSSLESAGTQIPTTNGSSNVSGGAVNASTNVDVQIDGRDLELASAGDGTKIIKVFVQDDAGGWSV